jgi:hypothetical protein
LVDKIPMSAMDLRPVKTRLSAMMDGYGEFLNHHPYLLSGNCPAGPLDRRGHRFSFQIIPMPELNGNPGPFSVHSFNERFQLLDPVQFEKEVHRGSMDDDQTRPSPGSFRIIPRRLLIAEAEIRDHRSKDDPVAKLNVLNS